MYFDKILHSMRLEYIKLSISPKIKLIDKSEFGG